MVCYNKYIEKIQKEGQANETYKKKRANYEGSIRKVYNDDKTEILGLIGSIDDLLKEGIMDSCEFPKSDWCFIPQNCSLPMFDESKEKLIDQMKINL